MKIKYLAIIFSTFSIFLQAQAFATEDPTVSDSKPFSYDASLFSDGVTGFSGPLESRAGFLTNLVVNFNFDNSQLLKWPGSSALITAIGIYGTNPNSIVGSAQGFDNIESNYNTIKLYQAWIQQELSSNKASLLVGLYDLNTEFYVTESSLLYIMSPLGIGTDAAQAGANGPSIFPTTAVGARLKLSPTETSYAQFALVDGVAGNPNKPYGTHILIQSKNGLLIVGEAGKLTGPDNAKGKYALGIWDYTATADELYRMVDEENCRRSHNQGIYALIDIPLYQASSQGLQSVNFFIRPGLANEHINQFSPTLATGITVTAPFKNRDDDAVGVALAYAKTTTDYRQAQAPMELLSETIYEATYSAKINDYLALQPTLQYIKAVNQDPSNPAEQNSLLGILRVKITL